MRPSFIRVRWPSGLLFSTTSKRCRMESTKLREDLPPTTKHKQGSRSAFSSPANSPVAGTAAPVESTPNRRKGRGLRRFITTLDPARLDSSCFLDFSGLIGLCIYYAAFPECPRMNFLRAHYQVTGKGIHLCFPQDTHGFLYFHRDEQDPLQSQIRFRVTQDSDPTRSFASGHDLTYGSGYTWKLLLANVATRPGVRAMLLRDRLVDNALLAQLQARSASGKHPVRRKRVVSALGDPFTLEFKNTSVYLVVHVAGEDRVYATRGPLCNDIRMHKASMVYEGGSALCRLERSTLSQHAGRRIVVMRLLKILQPPKRRLDLPSTDGVSVPAEGELFTSWFRDVDAPGKRSETLKLLYDAADNVGRASD